MNITIINNRNCAMKDVVNQFHNSRVPGCEYTDKVLTNMGWRTNNTSFSYYVEEVGGDRLTNTSVNASSDIFEDYDVLCMLEVCESAGYWFGEHSVDGIDLKLRLRDSEIIRHANVDSESDYQVIDINSVYDIVTSKVYKSLTISYLLYSNELDVHTILRMRVIETGVCEVLRTLNCINYDQSVNYNLKATIYGIDYCKTSYIDYGMSLNVYYGGTDIAYNIQLDDDGDIYKIDNHIGYRRVWNIDENIGGDILDSELITCTESHHITNLYELRFNDELCSWVVDDSIIIESHNPNDEYYAFYVHMCETNTLLEYYEERMDWFDEPYNYIGYESIADSVPEWLYRALTRHIK